jgi:hypothetical protein
VKVAFDIGGVISKYPGEFRELIASLIRGAHQVFVISDMHPREKIIQVLRMNHFVTDEPWPLGGVALVPEDNVYSADYETHGEACKAVLLEQLQVDLFFDDFIGYVTPGGAPIRLLVMPDHEKPYYADSWKMPDGEPAFGRRTYTKKQTKGRDA